MPAALTLLCVFPLSGVAFADQNGHAVVVHDAAGDRIGCGVLGAPQQYVAAIGTYPAYAGSLAPAGDVFVGQQLAGSVLVQFDLSGLEANATGGNAASRPLPNTHQDTHKLLFVRAAHSRGHDLRRRESGRRALPCARQ